MGFNYAHAERVWAYTKAQEAYKLRALGVDEDTIQALHTYDWEMFKRERNYRLHEQAMSHMMPEVPAVEQPSYVTSVSALLDEISREWLFSALRGLDQTTLQILLMKVQGYTSPEISLALGIADTAIDNRLSRLRKKLKKFL